MNERKQSDKSLNKRSARELLKAAKTDDKAFRLQPKQPTSKGKRVSKKVNSDGSGDGSVVS